MAADIKKPANLSFSSESGDIVHLLSAFTGESADKIEHLLQKGIMPWTLAMEYGVLDELRDTLLERVITQLEHLVENNYITREDADELIACFEMNVPDGE